MPLVTCPDCSREVSTLASACPQCGRPMMPAPGAAHAAEPIQEQTLWRGSPSPMLLMAHFAGIAFLLLAALGLTFLNRNSGGDPGLTTFIWAIAGAALLIQLIALAIAWVRLRSTHYTLTNQRVLIEQGIFTKTLNEIDLRYVDDSLFMQSFAERIVGIGHVTLVSSDKTSPQYVLRAIAAPRQVRETIRSEAYKASQRQLFTRAT